MPKYKRNREASFVWKIEDLPHERWRSMENQRFTTLPHSLRTARLLLLPDTHLCVKTRFARLGRRTKRRVLPQPRYLLRKFTLDSSLPEGAFFDRQCSIWNLSRRACLDAENLCKTRQSERAARWHSYLCRAWRVEALTKYCANYPVELASRRRNFKRQGVRAGAMRSRRWLRRAERLDRQRSILEFIRASLPRLGGFVQDKA